MNIDSMMKNSILTYNRDYTKFVRPEVCVEKDNHNTQTSNIDKRLDKIIERLNKLDSFVGMPYVVPFDGIMTLYPARENGAKKVSQKAVSYTFDLKPYRDKFFMVRFEADTPVCKENDTIVRGIIIDNDGNVEYVCNKYYTGFNNWTRLPITENSSYLVATVPLEDGKPAWIPEKIILLPRGLAQDIAEVCECINEDISEVYERIYAIKGDNERVTDVINKEH